MLVVLIKMEGLNAKLYRIGQKSTDQRLPLPYLKMTIPSSKTLVW
jgi:hypothetical protein